MKHEIWEELIASIDNEKITFDGETNTPALEALYMHYTEYYPLHSDESKRLSAELNSALDILEFQQQDYLFSLSSQLAAEHERLAFLEGLKLGAQLIMELQKSNA